MQLMRRHDPQAKEAGFQTLLPHAAEHIDELIAEFPQEPHDHGLRCWLLELIGQARSTKALSILTEQLHSDDESLRSWATRGLEQLDVHKTANVLAALPKSAHPGAKAALAEIWGAEDKRHAYGA